MMKKLSITLTSKESLWGWIYYPIQLLVLPVAISLIDLLTGSHLDDAGLNFLFYCINFLAVFLIFFRFLKDNGKIAIASPVRCLVTAAGGLVINWVLSYAVQILIFTVDPSFFNVNDAAIDTMAQKNFNLVALGTVWLVPLAEESLYRGLIFGQIYRRKPLAAYIISTCVFAAIHVIGYIGSYEPLQLCLCFLQYLPAGIALAWTYVKADTIWAPILMHMTYNQLGIAAMR